MWRYDSDLFGLAMFGLLLATQLCNRVESELFLNLYSKGYISNQRYCATVA
jgi:hypothetical protein